MRISITIDSESGEDLRGELARFLKFDGGVPGEAPTATEEWTAEEFTNFWGGLREEARALLAEIARHAPTYTFADLRKEVGIPGQVVAGRMSSVGHRQNKFPNRPAVVTRDWNAGVYHMDKRIADWILKLASGRKLT